MVGQKIDPFESVVTLLDYGWIYLVYESLADQSVNSKVTVCPFPLTLLSGKIPASSTSCKSCTSSSQLPIGDLLADLQLQDRRYHSHHHYTKLNIFISPVECLISAGSLCQAHPVEEDIFLGLLLSHSVIQWE